MTPRFRLRLSEPGTVTRANASGVFNWLTDRNSTIYASLVGGGHLGPSVGGFGVVPPPNIDFARIAVAAFAADRSVSRTGGGSDWNRRTFQLKVAVRDADLWTGVAGELKAVVDFLTGDDWSFEFVRVKGGSEAIRMASAEPSRVVLLSGGADSAVGALLSRAELADNGESQTLVSHYTSTVLPSLQREIVGRVEDLVAGPAQEHLQVRLGRASEQLDGELYGDETSTRSRSLLFIALGLAVASIHEAPLWIPENGFASINPPLGLDRLGSLSTRTTHPAFLSGLRALLARVGAHADLVNPYANLTKGEMFSRVADLLGAKKAGDFLTATHSCAHTGQRTFHVPSSTPCGVCFGCVVRRASFDAAGLDDRTEYIDASADVKLEAWLGTISVEEPMRRFLERGLKDSDLIALGLPAEHSLADARALCDRGMQELRGFVA